VVVAGETMTRILILTASVGEGHDLPARCIAAQLELERPDADIATADGLEPMGRLVQLVSEESGRIVFFRFQWLWDLGFWCFARWRPTRRLTQALLTRLGSAGLLRLIARFDPDIVVSTYPNTTEVLGRLRQRGLVEVPVCSAISDVAALRYWAGPGIDLHLIAYPQSAEEVRHVAGRSATVAAVHGMTAAAFRVPRRQADARRRLGLPSRGEVVLVSGGGWGVGDLPGAIAEALAVERVRLVVCLAGRNDKLLQRLRSSFEGEPRLRLEGFTDQMPEWMAASDALVHSTGGLTVLEARMRGLPVVSYGWGRGHIRPNNAAFERFGLAEVVSDRAELRRVLEGTLARPRPSSDVLDSLPSAASLILALADAHAGETR
jgi:UDP-N-acetylglucosamine:LPS N-acetylglucosamine transferase